MFVGVDLGQSAVKVTALAAGHPRYSEHEAYPSATPRDGWVEQDPAAWWRAFETACLRLTARLPEPVSAVCVTGATHHVVLLDREWAVLRPVLTMRDVRAAPQATRLRARNAGRPLRATRNTPDAAWALPQLMWLREHDPTWSRLAHLETGKDHLVRLLTGRHVSDAIDVEGTLLRDVAAGDWDDTLLHEAGLARWNLPEVVRPGEVVGLVLAEAARRTGLPAGTPVVAGASDTAAEAYAAGATTPGSTVVKLASSGNVNVVTDRAEPDAGWVTYTSLSPGLDYHAVPTSSAASAFAWLRTAVDPGAHTSFDRLDGEAVAVGPSAPPLFLPYLGGMRAPVWDPLRKAAFVGIDPSHGRGHLVRAVYEGVAMSMRRGNEVLRRHGHVLGCPFVIGGGAASATWRQVISDTLAVPVERPPLSDASDGAALLAWRSLTAAEPDVGSLIVPPPVRHRPDPTAVRRLNRTYDWFTDVSDTLAGHDAPHGSL